MNTTSVQFDNANYSPKNLPEYSTAQLVHLINDVNDEADAFRRSAGVAEENAPEVRRFADRKSAIKRCWNALLKLQALRDQFHSAKEEEPKEEYSAPDGANSPATKDGKELNKALGEELEKHTPEKKARKSGPRKDDRKVKLVSFQKTNRETVMNAMLGLLEGRELTVDEYVEVIMTHYSPPRSDHFDRNYIRGYIATAIARGYLTAD